MSQLSAADSANAKAPAIRRAALSAALLCIFAMSLPVLADFKESYRQAVEAIEAGRFADAIPFLREALAERNEARIGVFGRNRVYLPHYYLGVAQAETGNCRAALASWQTSETQGKIVKTQEYQDLLRRRRGCTEQLEQVETAVEAAAASVESAKSAADQVRSLSRQEELKSTWRQKFGAQQDTAIGRLQQAEKALQDGEAQDDVAGLENASTLANEAEQMLKALASDAGALKVSVREAATTARAEVEDISGNLRDMRRSIEDLKPFPSRLKRRAGNADDLLDEVEKKLGSASSAELVDLKERLTVAMSQLRRAARRPPGSLNEAVDAFLRGDFLKTLEVLEGKSYQDRRAQGHACLLRSAATFSIWVHGGEPEGELQEDLRSKVANCAELENVPQPSGRFFSPRFSDFYRTTLEELALAASLSVEGTEEGIPEDGESGEVPTTESGG